MEENKVKSPMDEEISEEERKFLDDLNEKYKDRDDYKDTPIISEDQKVVIDKDGNATPYFDDNNGQSVKVAEDSGDIFKDIIENDDKDIDTSNVKEEDVEKELKDVYDLSDEDIAKMLIILTRIERGEKFSVYNAMPQKLQMLVTSCMASNGIPNTLEYRNAFAKELINDMLGDIKNDESFIEIDKALKEAVNIPNLLDFEAESWQETFEVKLSDTINKCKEDAKDKEETDPDGAAKLINTATNLENIRSSWKDSYTLVRMTDLIDNSVRIRNRITKEVQYYNKFINTFTFQAKESKYIINDVSSIPRVFAKYFGNEYSDTIYKAFTILFCQTCQGLNFNKPSDVAYIYYSIKNFISLEFLDSNRITDFNKTLTSNIRTILNRIVELDKEYQERLLDRKNNKKRGK